MKYRVAWGLFVASVLLVGIAGAWWVTAVLDGAAWRTAIREGVLWQGGNYFGIIGLVAGLLCACLALAGLLMRRHGR